MCLASTLIRGEVLESMLARPMGLRMGGGDRRSLVGAILFPHPEHRMVPDPVWRVGVWNRHRQPGQQTVVGEAQHVRVG
jgi:hypothetical protein